MFPDSFFGMFRIQIPDSLFGMFRIQIFYRNWRIDKCYHPDSWSSECLAAACVTQLGQLIPWRWCTSQGNVMNYLKGFEEQDLESFQMTSFTLCIQMLKALQCIYQRYHRFVLAMTSTLNLNLLGLPAWTSILCCSLSCGHLFFLRVSDEKVPTQTQRHTKETLDVNQKKWACNGPVFVWEKSWVKESH